MSVQQHDGTSVFAWITPELGRCRLGADHLVANRSIELVTVCRVVGPAWPDHRLLWPVGREPVGESGHGSGVAAVWALGIGVGGTVVTALAALHAGRQSNKAALHAAREAGRAQVEAALAGCGSSWTGCARTRSGMPERRLRSVPDRHRGRPHGARPSGGDGPRYFEEGSGSGSAVGEAGARGRYQDLLLRHSALRL